MHIYLSAVFVFLMGVFPSLAQEPGQPKPPAGREGHCPQPGEFVAGRITEVTPSGFTLERRDGSTVKVQLTDKTEFRKDGERAKREDFPVGAIIFVRGTGGDGGAWVAQTVATRSGRSGGPGGMAMFGGEFVAGEVKSIDPPSLTVLKPDGSTVTLELDENTSLRKGRESITMADIHVGDHVVVRGEMKEGKFEPKGLNLVTPEQWKRMMQMRDRRGAQSPSPSSAQDKKEEPQKPPRRNFRHALSFAPVHGRSRVVRRCAYRSRPATSASLARRLRSCRHGSLRQDTAPRRHGHRHKHLDKQEGLHSHRT